MGSFPLLQAVGCITQLLSHTSYHGFSISGPATGHSHAASVQHDLANPSSVLLVPSASSLSPDANGGIDLLFPRTNQTWKGESTEFQVKIGY